MSRFVQHLDMFQEMARHTESGTLCIDLGEHEGELPGYQVTFCKTGLFRIDTLVSINAPDHSVIECKRFSTLRYPTNYEETICTWIKEQIAILMTIEGLAS